MSEILNLTPHDITFIVGEEKVVIPASGKLARVAVSTQTTGMVDNIPVTESVFGNVEGLPEPKDGTIYIVSSLVAQRCSDRRDVFIPNESVRDEAGRIIGCRSLGRV